MDKAIITADEVFGKVTTVLDDIGMKYDSNKDERIVSFSMATSDLDVRYSVCVEDSLRLRMLLEMPFTVRENARIDVAYAVQKINSTLSFGNFDYDIERGLIWFRLSNGFEGVKFTELLVFSMFKWSSEVTDKYNDSLFMLSVGKMTLDEFFAQLASDEEE